MMEGVQSEPVQRFSLQQSFQYCRKIALGHYENFPVGSFLIPRKIRPHFFALYAFMRTADDFADEPGHSKEERVTLLRNWREQLHNVFAGELPVHPIFIALQNTIATFHFSVDPFDRLLDAFEFDAQSGPVRFETMDEFHWYTHRSAEPVGELVLRLFGYDDPKLIELSNSICSGLQLLNFIQDIEQDLENDRIYFPRSDFSRFGVEAQQDIVHHAALPKLLSFETAQARKMMDAGRKLPQFVHGRLRYELRAVIRGAYALICRIEDRRGNIIGKRPKLSKFEHLTNLLKALVNSGTGMK